MKLKDLLESTPGTVISGILSTDLDHAIKLLKKAGFNAIKYQDEYIGVFGDNSKKTKSEIHKILKSQLHDENFEISESLNESERKEFNCVYDKAEQAMNDMTASSLKKGILKDIKFSGRASEQNLEDAFDNISAKEISVLYKKYCK